MPDSFSYGRAVGLHPVLELLRAVERWLRRLRGLPAAARARKLWNSLSGRLKVHARQPGLGGEVRGGGGELRDLAIRQVEVVRPMPSSVTNGLVCERL